MTHKNFFTGGGRKLLVLFFLFSLNLFPCGNAPQTNLGNYKIPIIQSTPPVLMTPNRIFLPNAQTLQECNASDGNGQIQFVKMDTKTSQ